MLRDIQIAAVKETINTCFCFVFVVFFLHVFPSVPGALEAFFVLNSNSVDDNQGGNLKLKVFERLTLSNENLLCLTGNSYYSEFWAITYMISVYVKVLRGFLFYKWYIAPAAGGGLLLTVFVLVIRFGRLRKKKKR